MSGFRRKCAVMGAAFALLFGVAAVQPTQAQAQPRAAAPALAPAAPAQGDHVLDQAPAEAMVIMRVKNISQTSKKLAKMAKDLGIDQMAPEWADPLGAMEEQAGVSKGLNRNGELALVFVNPKIVGGDPQKAAMALIPVDDYDAFVSNFKETQKEGAITRGTPPTGGPEMYMAKWGGYAAVSGGKEVLALKPAGMKLSGMAAKENDAKDFLVYANMKVIRTELLPMLQQGRDELLQGIEGQIGEDPQGKKFLPLAKAAANQMVEAAKTFLQDADSATLGMNLTDAGMSFTVMAEFAPDSYSAGVAKGIKNTDGPLIVGLPNRKYIAYGGAAIDGESANKVLGDMLDPIAAELAKLPEGKSFNLMIDATKKSLAATQSMSFGYLAADAQLGQDALIQEVAVMRGDAPKIIAAGSDSMKAMNDVYKLMPAGAGKTTITYTPDAKTVAGVKLNQFKMDMEIPDNDPQAAQMKQMFDLMYGAGGITGVMGQLDAKTVIGGAGISDETITELVASAKAGTDTAAKNAGLQAVNAKLPKSRAMVVYVEIDQIINMGLRLARQQGAQINAKIGGDLPPVGMAVGSNGNAVWGETFVSMDLVKGIVAFAIEAQKAGAQPGGGL